MLGNAYRNLSIRFLQFQLNKHGLSDSPLRSFSATNIFYEKEQKYGINEYIEFEGNEDSSSSSRTDTDGPVRNEKLRGKGEFENFKTEYFNSFHDKGKCNPLSVSPAFRQFSEEEEAAAHLVYERKIRFERLPARSLQFGKEMIGLGMGHLKGVHKQFVVKDRNAIQHLMLNGAVPQKIYFSSYKALLALNESIGAVKLYKVDDQDLKYWTNHKSEGLLAIFHEDNLKVLKANVDIFPMNVIINAANRQSTTKIIVTAAAACGCKSLLFTESFGINWKTTSLPEILIPAVAIPEVECAHWNNLNNSARKDVPVLALGNILKNWDYPSIDLYNINFKEFSEYILLAGDSPSVRANEFCEGRVTKKILFPTYSSIQYTNFGCIFHMTIFQLRRAWELHKSSVGITENQCGTES